MLNAIATKDSRELEAEPNNARSIKMKVSASVQTKSVQTKIIDKTVSKRNALSKIPHTTFKNTKVHQKTKLNFS